MNRVAQLVIACSLLAGCSAINERTAEMTALQDGQVPLPADYRSWPKFLSEVQRPDASQGREIYVNPIGYGARSGQPFAPGTIFVMENYAAGKGVDGKPVVTGGKLVKGPLLRVLVMAKGPGYASEVPAELKNGDWAYASYDAAGMKTTDKLAACRNCHLPLAREDFVFRAGEHFVARAQRAY